ncbi:MAG: class I adenylate cyclase [Nitrospinota bacterium]
MRNISGSRIDKLLRSFNKYNSHRIEFAKTILTGDEIEFFNALPLLLHYDFGFPSSVVPEQPGTSRQPPAGIYDFTEDEAQRVCLTSIFPDEEIVEPAEGPFIHSLALVGSIGSVGQTMTSDFDYVVFISKKEIDKAGVMALRSKLNAIEEWAMKNLGMEVHFFISDWEEFSENRFGESDKENVGSALGTLFKDEFYRTAIFIAGKRPFWWLLPPGFPEDSLEEFKKEAEKKDAQIWDRYLDLGHVLSANEEEFFGGVLWQMNKALEYPFKSLLKMGLMETYLFSAESGLLCEELKKRLSELEKMEMDIDPYIMLLNRQTTYYLHKGMDKEAQFLRAAFLKKSGIPVKKAEELLTSLEWEMSQKEKYISALMEQWGWSAMELEEFSRLLTGESENRYRSLGELNRFLIDVYKRLDDRIKESGIGETSISDEDMAVLGRRIFVYFDRRSDKERRNDRNRGGEMGRRAHKRKGEKIPYIYPGNAPEEPLTECALTVGKTDDGSKAWLLYDFILTGSTPEEMRSFREPIMHFQSLIKMLGWMVINGIWRQGGKFYFDGAMTGYNAKDVEMILEELYVFFRKDKYIPTREDYLMKNERIVKAFIIPNFGMTETPNRVENAEILMLNSWGELTVLPRKPEKEAVKEIAGLLVESSEFKKPFTFTVSPPLSQEDPGLADEFNLGVSRLVDLSRAANLKKRKAKIDSFN